MSISAENLNLLITLGLRAATTAAETFSKVALAQAGGAPITDADLDEAAARVGTSRAALVDEIAKAKAEGR